MLSLVIFTKQLEIHVELEVVLMFNEYRVVVIMKRRSNILKVSPKNRCVDSNYYTFEQLQ